MDTQYKAQVTNYAKLDVETLTNLHIKLKLEEAERMAQNLESMSNRQIINMILRLKKLPKPELTAYLATCSDELAELLKGSIV